MDLHDLIEREDMADFFTEKKVAELQVAYRLYVDEEMNLIRFIRNELKVLSKKNSKDERLAAIIKHARDIYASQESRLRNIERQNKSLSKAKQPTDQGSHIRKIEELRDEIESDWGKLFEGNEQLESILEEIKLMREEGFRPIAPDKAGKEQAGYNAYVYEEKSFISFIRNKLTALKKEKPEDENIADIVKEARKICKRQERRIDSIEDNMEGFINAENLIDQRSHIRRIEEFRGEIKLEWEKLFEGNEHLKLIPEEFESIRKEGLHPIAPAKVEEIQAGYNVYMDREKNLIRFIRDELTALREENPKNKNIADIVNKARYMCNIQEQRLDIVKEHIESFGNAENLINQRYYIRRIELLQEKTKAEREALLGGNEYLKPILEETESMEEENFDSIAPDKVEDIQAFYRAYVNEEKILIRFIRKGLTALKEEHPEDKGIVEIVEKARDICKRQEQRLSSVKEHIEGFINAESLIDQRYHIRRIELLQGKTKAEREALLGGNEYLKPILEAIESRRREGFHRNECSCNDKLQEIQSKAPAKASTKDNAGAGTVKNYMAEITARKDAVGNKKQGMQRQAPEESRNTHSKGINKPQNKKQDGQTSGADSSGTRTKKSSRRKIGR